MKRSQLKQIIKEEVQILLNESKQNVRLDDLTFDKLKTIFPNKFQKKSTTRIVNGEQEDMYRDGINFPQLGNMVAVRSNSDLEEWKDYFKKRYGNVDVELDPNSTVWYQLVQINDPKFQSDDKQHTSAVQDFLREGTSLDSIVREETQKFVALQEKKKKLYEFVDKAVGSEVVSMVYEIASNHGYAGSCSKQYKTIAKQVLDILPQISKENRKAFIREVKNTERLMDVDEIILV